ncbi:ImmA/IrrE family metallo-endopeptidase [bacterium]|nr:ImmA/IrrE family metallo-endopeptidase [bacterium]MBU1024906.1 ImmA/IrrE family metallo-endopeptidase [bacterium]
MLWKIYQNRYRFTLAHEIGHFVLHKFIYENASFSNVDDWMEFNNTMPEDQHSWFEYQAYAFAGLILVPNEKFISKIDSIKLEMKAHNLDLNNLGDREREVIIEVLASYFFVSKEVIRRRLDKEEEIAKIKLI